MLRRSAQYMSKRVSIGKAAGEVRPVDSAERPYQRITVFSADFPILIAMSIIQSRLLHF